MNASVAPSGEKRGRPSVQNRRSAGGRARRGRGRSRGGPVGALDDGALGVDDLAAVGGHRDLADQALSQEILGVRRFVVGIRGVSGSRTDSYTRGVSMRVLLVGSGGREHALAWGLARSPLWASLHAAPGNPGIGEVATLHDVAVGDHEGLTELASSRPRPGRGGAGGAAGRRPRRPPGGRRHRRVRAARGGGAARGVEDVRQVGDGRRHGADGGVRGVRHAAAARWRSPTPTATS